MFQRVGAEAFKKDLSNTIALCSELGNPEKKFRSIHVAGTNGKGSVSSMLAAVFAASGYKTGLYTSPHLKDFTERIRINGNPIPESSVIDLVKRMQATIEKISPSFFEVTVAMAFEYFANEEVDIAVIEVGMGGRLDSTNVINPDLSIITNISMDHAQFLGDNLGKIAQEKAGIIKPGVPVIVGLIQEETQSVFESIAARNKAELSFCQNFLKIERIKGDLFGQFFRVDEIQSDTDLCPKTWLEDLFLPLPGLYQKENLRTVLQGVKMLRKLGWNLSDQSIREGFLNLRKLSGLRGRMEVLSEKPLVICDVGHNEAGIDWILKQLKTLKYGDLHLVWGAVNDKDLDQILSRLPINAVYYFVKPEVPRGLEADILQEKAEQFGLKGKTWPTVKKGLEAAIKAAHCPRDSTAPPLIFVGGSTFVVAEVV